MQKPPITKVKDSYKLRNWSSYNRNLCRRGNITIWLDDSVMRDWRDLEGVKKIVGEQLYPNSVILLCLVLKAVYGQKLRQTTGFVSGLLSLMGKGGYPVPDYSTLCRRQSLLDVVVNESLKNSGSGMNIAIDSTGLKVYGDGEWKVRKHGASKRRTWMKLHIGININSQEIVSVALTGNDKDDATTGKEMLKGKVGGLKGFWGDGGYDKIEFREFLGEGVRQVIPPQNNAIVRHGTKKKPLGGFIDQRNESVEEIKKEGREEWKKANGYHRRSLNEVVMFRYKTQFGGKLNARKFENQNTEVKINCNVLNQMLAIGMPVSYKVI